MYETFRNWVHWMYSVKPIVPKDLIRKNKKEQSKVRIYDKRVNKICRIFCREQLDEKRVHLDN